MTPATTLESLALSPTAHTVQIPVELIDPSPFQPRRVFDPDALQELADNIASFGLLSPLVVRQPTEGRYELIAGERRLRALKLAGIATAPATVQDVTDEQAQALAIAENIQRVDLNPVEEARAIRSLRKILRWKVGEIAQKMGKSASYVETAIRLCELPDETLAKVEAGQLSRSQADALVKFATVGDGAGKAAAAVMGDFVAANRTPAAQLTGDNLHYQYGMMSDLQKAGLVRHIWQARFDRSVCNQCPFGAHFDDYCFLPTHYDALTSAVETETDRAYKEKLEAAQASGAQLVELSLLPYDGYKSLYQHSTTPEGCGPDCECRARAIDSQGRELEVCTDPKRFEKLEKAGSRKVAKQRREYGKEQVEALEKWFDELATALDAGPGVPSSLSDITAVIVSRIVRGGYQSSAARDAAKRAFRWVPGIVPDGGMDDTIMPALARQEPWRLLFAAAEWLARAQLHEHYAERLGSDPTIPDWLVWGIAPLPSGAPWRRRQYELGKSPIAPAEERESRPPSPVATKSLEQIAGEGEEALAARMLAEYEAWAESPIDGVESIRDMPQSILVAARLLRNHGALDRIDEEAADLVHDLLVDDESPTPIAETKRSFEQIIADDPNLSLEQMRELADAVAAVRYAYVEEQEASDELVDAARRLSDYGLVGLDADTVGVVLGLLPDDKEGTATEPGVCRVCGCDDEHACEGGCSWVEANLCSACVADA